MMINFTDLPDTMAVFPLTGAILLPRSRLPLHIFEPRYLAMIEDALKSDRRLIGMVQPRAGTGEVPALSAVGCAGRITSFSETDDGRFMITLTGVSRFRLGEEIGGFVPYRRCTVEWRPFAADVAGEDKDREFARQAFLEQLARYFKINNLGVDWTNLKEAGDEMLVNALAMLCPFGSEEKQALLEAQTLTERRRVLETLIRFALQTRGAGDEVRQ